ncbi:hypothetical protein N656DRAFT_127821 [Canariomyces notabilis]|uniref:Uncharacterized protein n=1 Tax=Canariomyces notabilis TaxID=2074819 RepID=A0AAN6TCK3_9PEZI|nr:hypothetical protein N656DRAFT_127821 [Canariomyces arenarius]
MLPNLTLGRGTRGRNGNESSQPVSASSAPDSQLGSLLEARNRPSDTRAERGQTRSILGPDGPTPRLVNHIQVAGRADLIESYVASARLHHRLGPDIFRVLGSQIPERQCWGALRFAGVLLCSVMQEVKGCSLQKRKHTDLPLQLDRIWVRLAQTKAGDRYRRECRYPQPQI